jgi:hypothetical protein
MITAGNMQAGGKATAEITACALQAWSNEHHCSTCIHDAHCMQAKILHSLAPCLLTLHPLLLSNCCC